MVGLCFSQPVCGVCLAMSAWCGQKLQCFWTPEACASCRSTPEVLESFQNGADCKVTQALCFSGLSVSPSIVESSLQPYSMALCSDLPSKSTYSAFLVLELNTAVPCHPHFPVLACTAQHFLPRPVEQQHCLLSIAPCWEQATPLTALGRKARG